MNSINSDLPGHLLLLFHYGTKFFDLVDKGFPYSFQNYNVE